MASYTQIGSVAVQAFQWTGQAFTSLPAFAKALFLHRSSDDLHVPSRTGTHAVKINQWVVQHPDGIVDILSNSAFTALYH